MLQVRENEISLRKWSDATALLSTLEGTLSSSVPPPQNSKISKLTPPGLRRIVNTT